MKQLLVALILTLTACSKEYGNYPAPAPDKPDSADIVRRIRLLPFYEKTDSLFSLGVNYNSLAQFDSGRYYLEEALRLPGGSEWQGGRIITNIANSYSSQGRYAEALKYYLEALKVSEKMASKKKGSIFWIWGKANSLRVIANAGEAYYHMGNLHHALAYAERGEQIMAEMNEYYGYPRESELMNHYLSYMYPQVLYTAAIVWLDKGNTERAEKYFLRGFKIAYNHTKKHATAKDKKADGNYWYCAYNKEGLARVCLLRKEYTKALDYAIEALSFGEKHGDPQVIAKILATFSDIYLAQDNHTKCEHFALEATKADSGYLKLNPALAYNMAITGLYAGKREQTLNYLRFYSDWMKKNTDKKFRETMASMEIQFETEKKEQQINTLKNERELYTWSGVTGVILALLAGVILWLKIRNAQKEKQLIATNAVQEGEMGERERIAGELHDRLLGTLAAVKSDLRNTDANDKLNECIEEIRRISRNLMPLPLRFGIKTALEDFTAQFPNVQFHFFGEEKHIQKRVEFALYCCANELITNSIRHSKATNINVQLVQGAGAISLTVQDNGIGFDEKTVIKGVGLRSVKDRVTSCNGKMDIVSSPGKGTEITIELNY